MENSLRRRHKVALEYEQGQSFVSTFSGFGPLVSVKVLEITPENENLDVILRLAGNRSFFIGHGWAMGPGIRNLKIIQPGFARRTITYSSNNRRTDMSE
jgi:hypothetical protein